MATQRRKQVRVRGGLSSACLPQSPPSVSLKPDTELNKPWKRKKCWTADALCRLHSSFTPQYASEQDLGSPEALILPSKTTEPFLPRFLLPVRLCQSQSAAPSGIFYAGQIGFVAEKECAILPIRELAAQTDRVPWYGSPSRADSPCSGRTDKKATHLLDAFLGLYTAAARACGCTDSGAPSKQSSQHRTPTTAAPAALPAPPPSTMRNSRRPPRPKQQPREYLRCAQCGPDPTAHKTSTDGGLKQHMEQKTRRTATAPSGVGQLCRLDRAPCGKWPYQITTMQTMRLLQQ